MVGAYLGQHAESNDAWVGLGVLKSMLASMGPTQPPESCANLFNIILTNHRARGALPLSGFARRSLFC